MRKKKKSKVLDVLIVILLLALAALLIFDRAEEKELQEELHERAEQQRLAVQEAERVRQEKERNSSFYQRLAEGFDVEILIVGDSIGNGNGASATEHTWHNRLAKAIWTEYGAKVRMTNVSMGGNTSHAGYVRTMALNDGADYDLVILCYGQNDPEKDFALYYESIIRAVQEKYPKASIISILESSQRAYTWKMQTIQAIADHYGIPVVDTIAPFMENYDDFTGDGVHPNDEGYRLYCDLVMEEIRAGAAAYRGADPRGSEPTDERVTVFDTFQWYGQEQFVREGNTYILPLQASGRIMSIDYNFVSGSNSCRILVDGREYAAPEIVFNYDFSQRRILIVNDWLQGDGVNVQSEIRIVFAEDAAGKQQADGFHGIAVIGE